MILSFNIQLKVKNKKTFDGKTQIVITKLADNFCPLDLNILFKISTEIVVHFKLRFKEEVHDIQNS